MGRPMRIAPALRAGGQRKEEGMPWKIRLLVVAATATLLMIAPPEFRFSTGATAIAPDQGDIAPAFLSFTGGAVKAKLVRTETVAQVLSLPTVGFINVTNATLSRFVTSGTSDLFNVSFSAECSKSF